MTFLSLAINDYGPLRQGVVIKCVIIFGLITSLICSCILIASFDTYKNKKIFLLGEDMDVIPPVPEINNGGHVDRGKYT